MTRLLQAAVLLLQHPTIPKYFKGEAVSGGCPFLCESFNKKVDARPWFLLNNHNFIL